MRTDSSCEPLAVAAGPFRFVRQRAVRRRSSATYGKIVPCNSTWCTGPTLRMACGLARDRLARSRRPAERRVRLAGAPRGPRASAYGARALAFGQRVNVPSECASG